MTTAIDGLLDKWRPRIDAFKSLRDNHNTSTLQDAMAIELFDALAALVDEAKDRERQFPMQDGPSIPWSLAERIYYVYTGLYGEGQGMERLAQRGGFSWAEIPAFREAHRRRAGAYPVW